MPWLLKGDHPFLTPKFQDIFRTFLYFSRTASVTSIARHAIPKVTTCNSLGCGGTVSSAGGPGGQESVLFEDPAVLKAKKRSKTL